MYYFIADYPDAPPGTMYAKKVELHFGGEVIVGTDVTISGLPPLCPDPEPMPVFGKPPLKPGESG